MALKAEILYTHPCRCQTTFEVEAYRKSEADREIRRQKRKRCLNNAWWCLKLSNTYTLSAYTHRGWKVADYYYEKAELYRKWRKRWLEIADKFKE